MMFALEWLANLQAKYRPPKPEPEKRILWDEKWMRNEMKNLGSASAVWKKYNLSVDATKHMTWGALAVAMIALCDEMADKIDHI